MLKFAQYRSKLVEDTDKGTRTVETETPAQIVMPSPLVPDLERTIDDFIKQLKMQLVMPMEPAAHRGVWDRLKGWWSNLWYGRQNQENPYYWQNKLGDDMGRAVENVTSIPLSHYSVLREQANLLELALPAGTEKLRIMKVIDDWGRQFKTAIMQIVHRHNAPVTPPPSPDQPTSSPPPTSPSVPPEEKRQELPITPAKETENTALMEKKQKMLEELEALKDKMPSSTYELLKRNIQVGGEDQLNMVQVMLDRKRTAPMPEPKPEPPRQNLPQEVEMDEEDDGTPAAEPPVPDKRLWKELPPHIRQQWDEAGGGVAEKPGDPSWAAKTRLGIQTLPWVLRIGDPRIAELETIRNKSIYNRLISHKRVETPTAPIRTAYQLAKAVAEAKRLATDESQKISARNLGRWKQTRLKKDIKSRLGGEGEMSPEPVEKAEGGLKPPRVAPFEPEKPNKSVEEIKADLESIKSEVDIDALAQLEKWLDSGEPARIARAEQHIDAMKNMISHGEEEEEVEEEEEEEEEEEPEAPEPKDGIINFWDEEEKIEWTIRDKTARVISDFRRLVSEGTGVSSRGWSSANGSYRSRIS